MRFVNARASDISRSMPTIKTMPSTGIRCVEESVAASTMKPLPVTPAAPFEVIKQIASNVSSCVKVSDVFVACAMNIAPIVK